MALFKPVRRISSELPNIAKQDGQFLVATDTGEAFMDVSNSERIQLLGYGGGGSGDLSATQFTFVVDSDAALAAWANNTEGNDYTSVLIRPGEWSSSKEVNLTTAGTKVVVGMPESLLKFTLEYGLMYDEAPTTTDYWMWGVSADIHSSRSVVCAFSGCTNLTNCTGSGNATGSGSGFGVGFNGCTNLTNCTGTGISKYSNGFGFSGCDNITNCTATGSSGYGFSSCDNLTNCTATSIGGYGHFYYCNNLTNCTSKGSVGYAFIFAII